MTKLFFTSLIIFLLFIFAQGQQINKPVPKKVALFNSLAFSDEKTGIKKLVDAERIASDPGFISETDSKKILEIYKESYIRREKIIVEPVRNKISALLKQVENQNDIVLIDGVKLDEESLLLSFDERLDISKQFIAYFNKSEKFDKPLMLHIPDIRIAVINTELFYDKQKGIKNLLKLTASSFEAKKFCSEPSLCLEIIKSIQSFAKKEGCGMVLDSRKNLPAELGNFQMVDLTQKFINEYNSNH